MAHGFTPRAAKARIIEDQIAMTSSHSAFTGKIPQNYEKYLGPLIFQEYAEDLSRRVTVTKGGVVLEIAAGTGLATRQLRAAIPKDVFLTVTVL